jgi:hypothetical protein
MTTKSDLLDVTVTVSAHPESSWPGAGLLDLVPCISQDRQGHYVAVVFSLVQASNVLGACTVPITLLCVDVPRCQVCTSVAGAAEFFGGAEK